MAIFGGQDGHIWWSRWSYLVVKMAIFGGQDGQECQSGPGGAAASKPHFMGFDKQNLC